MAFWIAAGGLLVTTMAALLWALVRPRPPLASRRFYDLAVYRDQLDEVRRDVERGILAADQAEAARLEIKRRMLAADAAAEDEEPTVIARPPPMTWRRLVVVVVAVLVPAGSLALYLDLGSPGVPDLPFASRAGEMRVAGEERAEMERLTTRLAAQLEQQPDRVDGWLLLGRSLRTLGKYAESMEAFERAVALTGRAPAVLSEYAEVLVMAHGGEVPAAAVPLFEEAGRASPTDPRSRFYLGLAKSQKGDFRDALQEWVDLVAVSPKGAPWLAGLREQISAAAAAAGIDPATMVASPGLPGPPAEPAGTEQAARPLAPAAPAAAPEAEPGMAGPSAEDMKAAAGMTADERQAMIRGMVERLAERLRENPEDAAGWRRLARAYEVLGEGGKAKDALARAEAAEKKKGGP